MNLKKRYIKKFLRKSYLKKHLRRSYNKKYLINSYNKISYVKIRIKNNLKIRNTKLLIKKLNNIKNKSLLALKKSSENKHYIIKVLDKLYEMKKINGVSKYNKRMLKYINIFYKRRIRKYLRKMEKYIYLKQLIYINKSKFDYTLLQYLKNYLQVLFNKNVEFNFINLKRFYLNSNILSESILLKITRDRGKLLKYITKLKNIIKIRKKVFISESANKHVLNRKENLQNYIIKNLKYKHITGFRLEAKGRLNKRHTASRSISKLKYKGNLINIDSTFGGLSTVLLKGNLNSNVQYTKLNSKTNIGSFGIKG